MAKEGFTSKKCPGCGEENLRKKDDVCPECLGFIQTGREHQKMYDKLKSDKKQIECQVPFGWDGPGFYLDRIHMKTEDRDKLKDIFVKLSQLVSVPHGQKVGYGYMQYLMNSVTYEVDDGGASGYDLPVVYLEKKPGGKNTFNGQGKSVMPKEIYKCLNELNKQVEKILKETEKNAIEHGKNALFMLSSGKLTMKEFNEF